MTRAFTIEASKSKLLQTLHDPASNLQKKSINFVFHDCPTIVFHYFASAYLNYLTLHKSMRLFTQKRIVELFLLLFPMFSRLLSAKGEFLFQKLFLQFTIFHFTLPVLLSLLMAAFFLLLLLLEFIGEYYSYSRFLHNKKTKTRQW